MVIVNILKQNTFCISIAFQVVKTVATQMNIVCGTQETEVKSLFPELSDKCNSKNTQMYVTMGPVLIIVSTINF